MKLIDPAAAVTCVDVDDPIRQTYGYAKQGAGYGYSGVKGLNALLATASAAGSAPVIVATRLRKGSANSARGSARLVADSLKTTQACRADSAAGTVILRADSAYYRRDVIAAARRGGAHFSVTARKDRAVTRRDRRHRRGRMDGDPLPQGRLRRATRAVGVRRRGRRNHLHHFCF